MATGHKLLPEVTGISSSPDDPVIRILLMGRRKSGKSSSGNTILGERKFKVKKRESEVCEGKTQIGVKQVAVIDCPDLLDPDLNKEQLEMLKEQVVSRCSAGLSAVLLTVPLEKPVQNEEEFLDFIQRLFGLKVQKYIMILFTRGDELDELDDPQTIDEYLQNHADLQQLVAECGGKFHCFNNKCKVKGQVKEILQKIEGMMMKNGGKFIMERMRRRGSKNVPRVNFSGESPAEDPKEIHIPDRKGQIRVVLLGKTGAGKSATGNTIIGRNVFESFTSSNSQTKQCKSETTVRMGKEISVIDTPGLYDTKLHQEEVQNEIVKCITYASPGPHAFIIVIKVERFTEENKQTVEQLRKVFGEQIVKYTMILFTHKDQLEKKRKTIEEFVQESDPDLQSLIRSCGNRFLSLDNNSFSFQQFKELISKIETMVAENGGHFTNDMFDETEKHIKEVQKQHLNEKVKQYKQDFKIVDQTEWQKIFWYLAEESRREAEQSLISDVCITAVAKLMGKVVVTPEERESALKEAESKGIGRTEAVRLAIRATRKLAKHTMCGVQ